MAANSRSLALPEWSLSRWEATMASDWTSRMALAAMVDQPGWKQQSRRFSNAMQTFGSTQTPNNPSQKTKAWRFNVRTRRDVPKMNQCLLCRKVVSLVSVAVRRFHQNVSYLKEKLFRWIVIATFCPAWPSVCERVTWDMIIFYCSSARRDRSGRHSRAGLKKNRADRETNPTELGAIEMHAKSICLLPSLLLLLLWSHANSWQLTFKQESQDNLKRLKISYLNVDITITNMVPYAREEAL